MSADVVGVTKDNKFILSEAKGANIEHGLEQLEYSAEKLGKEKVIRYEMVVPDKLQKGYIIKENKLHYDTNGNGKYELYLIYGKPVFVTRTHLE